MTQYSSPSLRTYLFIYFKHSNKDQSHFVNEMGNEKEKERKSSSKNSYLYQSECNGDILICFSPNHF